MRAGANAYLQLAVCRLITSITINMVSEITEQMLTRIFELQCVSRRP